MKGSDEPVWTYEDYEDAFDGGSVNLSKLEVWGTGEGKERFELALADRLLDHRVQSQETRSHHSESCSGSPESRVTAESGETIHR